MIEEASAKYNAEPFAIARDRPFALVFREIKRDEIDLVAVEKRHLAQRR